PQRGQLLLGDSWASFGGEAGDVPDEGCGIDAARQDYPAIPRKGQRGDGALMTHQRQAFLTRGGLPQPNAAISTSRDEHLPIGRKGQCVGAALGSLQASQFPPGRHVPEVDLEVSPRPGVVTVVTTR